MADMWSAALMVVIALILPIILPLLYYIFARNSFRKYRIWILVSAAAVEIWLLYHVAPLVI